MFADEKFNADGWEAARIKFAKATCRHCAEGLPRVSSNWGDKVLKNHWIADETKPESIFGRGEPVPCYASAVWEIKNPYIEPEYEQGPRFDEELPTLMRQAIDRSNLDIVHRTLQMGSRDRIMKIAWGHITNWPNEKLVKMILKQKFDLE